MKKTILSILSATVVVSSTMASAVTFTYPFYQTPVMCRDIVYNNISINEIIGILEWAEQCNHIKSNMIKIQSQGGEPFSNYKRPMYPIFAKKGVDPNNIESIRSHAWLPPTHYNYSIGNHTEQCKIPDNLEWIAVCTR